MKKFARIVSDLKHKIFIVYVATLSVNSGDKLHPLKTAQITYLKVNEAFTKVSNKYADFADVFSPKLAAKLLKHMRINNYAIKLVHDFQPPYSLIYSLKSVELETLKIYIKNKLANSFIRLFKSFVKALIFFDKKSNRSLRLYVNYQGLNNPRIKNRYFLSLVGKLLD